MKITGKTLLIIDRLFWLPQRISEFFFVTILGRINSNPGDQIFVIKFMGIGSITRFAGLCEIHQVDKSKVTLLTLSSNYELCKLLGFKNLLLFRTENGFLFLKDCLISLFFAYRNRPALIIDYERCAQSVGIYRTLLSFFAKCKSISFDHKRSVVNHKQIIYSVDEVNQEELFLKGIIMMSKGAASMPTIEVIVHPTRILININASNYLLSRRYPMSLFAETITTLHAKDFNLEFYLTGTANESNYVDQLVKKLHGIPVHNMCGKLNLNELCDELSSCGLFITGDSGPMHIAAYLGVPTLIIWGPTQPEHFGYDQADHLHHTALKLPCSPCFKHPASDPARTCNGRIDCLKNIRPQVVSQKALNVLSLNSFSRKVRRSSSSADISKPQLQNQI